MSLSLSPEQRRALKKQAHHLNVIVQSGAAGLTEPVTAEIERALGDHELVKIRLAADDRDQRSEMVQSLCEQLQAACVQQIGHTATLYRPKPDKPNK